MAPSKNKSKLKINPEPFKPSHLSIPPSPFSPRTPLTNKISHHPTRRTKIHPPPDTTTPPPPPLQWLWQCHQCHRSYSLGVTRRCLEDGHHFCAGSTTVKAWRKPIRAKRVKRHRACRSEFDYQGWKDWGRWKRSGRRDSIYEGSSSSSSSFSSSSSSLEADESSDAQPTHHPHTECSTTEQQQQQEKDCWNACDYPSECRWGRRFGVHTPLTATFPQVGIIPASTFTGPTPTPDVATASLTTATAEGVLDPDNYQEPNNINNNPIEKKSPKTDLWDALLASAKRRKSVPPSSPLASVNEEASDDAAEVEAEAEKNKDGDVVMVNPTANAPSSSQVGSSPATALGSLKDVFRKSSRIYSRSMKRVVEVKGAEEAKSGDDLAPLKRVVSRDSGYHSTLESI